MLLLLVLEARVRNCIPKLLLPEITISSPVDSGVVDCHVPTAIESVPVGAATPIPILPTDRMRSLSVPAVANLIGPLSLFHKANSKLLFKNIFAPSDPV